MPPVPGRAQEEHKREAVGKTYPAVEETYHAVVSFSHGILFFPAAAPSKIDAT